LPLRLRQVAVGLGEHELQRQARVHTNLTVHGPALRAIGSTAPRSSEVSSSACA
jgi:hypothetical protein